MNGLLTRLIGVYCWVFFSLSAAVAADFFEPRGELTLATAVAAALQRNPELQSTEFTLRIAAAQIAQAKLRPNPELAASFENFAGRGEMRGTDSLETTLSLSQVIELGDKRRRRIDVARYDLDSATIARAAKQLDVLAEVTRRFIQAAEQQQQLLLTRRGAELSQQTLTAITARVAAARAPELEKSRAAIALGRAQLEQQHAEHSLLNAHRRLAALWGSTEPRFGDIDADLFDLPAVAPFDELMAKLKATPDFLHFASAARLRDAEWQLAQAEAKSNLTVGAGLRRFEATGDTGLVLNISLPLPLANPNRGAIQAAALRREQVQSDEQVTFIAAQAQLFEFYQNLQQARAETTSLRTQLIPQAEAALIQTRAGHERGRFSYLELATAERELLDLQSTAIATAASYHRVRAEIERLTNEPLAQN